MDERLIIWGKALLKEYGVNYEDFDLEAELDSSISWNENKTILIEKLKHLGSFDRAAEIKEVPETMSKTTERLLIHQLDDRLNDLLYESNHFVVIGMRGEGKSCLGYYLLEQHNKAERKCYVYNHPQPSKLPLWIENITKIENLPFNSVVLIDECSNDFDQYSYAKRSNTYLRDVLTKARHKNQSFIFITPTSKFINLNFLHLIGSWFLKEPSLFQKEEERKLLKTYYAKITERINKDEYYYFDDRLFMKGKFKMPDWYNKLSKAYSTTEAEEFKFKKRDKMRINATTTEYEALY